MICFLIENDILVGPAAGSYGDSAAMMQRSHFGCPPPGLRQAIKPYPTHHSSATNELHRNYWPVLNLFWIFLIFSLFKNWIGSSGSAFSTIVSGVSHDWVLLLVYIADISISLSCSALLYVDVPKIWSTDIELVQVGIKHAYSKNNLESGVNVMQT